jgi:hypothetical protein
MNKTSYMKYKKKGKHTKRRKYRLHKRTYKYASGGDVMYNLQNILGILNTNSMDYVSPQPFIQ